MIPLPGTTWTPSMPAISAIWPPRPRRVDGQAGLASSTSSPRALVVQPGAGAPRRPSRCTSTHRVVGEDAARRARAAPRASAQTVFQTSMLPSGTRNAREMPRVEPRLLAQRLGRRRSPRRARRSCAALEEPVGVGRIVVGRGDEQPARVLDHVGGDAAAGSRSPRCTRRPRRGPSRRSGRPSAAGRGSGRSCPRRGRRGRRGSTSKPRSAASQAMPAPVAPPPMTSTSVCSVVMARQSRTVGWPPARPPGPARVATPSRTSRRSA